jgi:hypothetical protein
MAGDEVVVELPRGVKGIALVEKVLFLFPSCAGVKDGESTLSDFFGWFSLELFEDLV